MVKAGLGWSIVPEICLSYFDGIAEPLFFADGTPLTRSTYLLYRRREAELPQVRAFIQTVCERGEHPLPRAARLTDFQNRSPLAVLCRQAAVFVIFSQNPIAEP